MLLTLTWFRHAQDAKTHTLKQQHMRDLWILAVELLQLADVAINGALLQDDAGKQALKYVFAYQECSLCRFAQLCQYIS